MNENNGTGNENNNPNDGGDGTGGDGGNANSGDANNAFVGLDAETLESIGKDGITDVAGLAKNFVDQKQYLSSSIRPPGPEATEEVRTAFYARLQEVAPNLIPRPDKEDAEAMNALGIAMGRPDQIDGYKMPELEGMDAEQVADFRQTAFDLQLTQTQLEGIIGKEHARTVAMGEAAETAHDADLVTLSQEWGVTYEPRLTEIRSFAEKSGAPAGLVEMLNNNRVPSESLKWLHSLATNTQVKGNELGQQEGGSSGGLTPAEAKERSLEILDRLSKMRPGDPQYKELMDKRMKYLEMAHPGAKTGLEGLRANSG